MLNLQKQQKKKCCFADINNVGFQEKIKAWGHHYIRNYIKIY